ncbi:hypothetical protein NG895_15380 [Aeoliella sp. ICT_H6.2]|uniref:Uncharacterized protein n=1 Tax=Aeoliella straminimaris TaxID=2954799 RepID=A0A9X2FBZ4_9BACT|nr:hypothetical protein [Aeoliella straminimaris]MCO6045292.1 hypothetical protein [Aeoliella straminimaris]
MQTFSALMLAGTFAGVVVLAVLGFRISQTVTSIGKQLEAMRTALLSEYPVASGRQRRLYHWSRHLHMRTLADHGFFTIWQWRESEKRWIVSSLVPPGFDPGIPPSNPGAFDGDHVKKWTPGAEQ